MKFSALYTDKAALKELGKRIMHERLSQNMTQAALADKAGIAINSIQRLEAGSVATRLSGFLRILKVLDALDRFDALFPEPAISPIDLIKLQAKQRKRASRPLKESNKPRTWTWGDA